MAELAAQSVPLPRELILEVIRVESGGKAGAVNPSSGASGLMQVMPITLEDFNQRHGTNYTLAEMRSGDEAAARKQIRVGLSTLARYWKRAYSYLKSRLGTVPVDELARIADLAYAAGWGAVKKKLEKLEDPTWAALQIAYPTWNALPHPEKVLADPKPWDLSAISKWLESDVSFSPSPVPPKKIADPRVGVALGILLLIAVYWAMKK